VSIGLMLGFIVSCQTANWKTIKSDVPSKTITAGNIITCPTDGRELYVLKKTINSGDVIQASFFEPIDQFIPIAGPNSLAICPFDGTFFMKGNLIHGYQLHLKGTGWF